MLNLNLIEKSPQELKDLLKETIKDQGITFQQLTTAMYTTKRLMTYFADTVIKVTGDKSDRTSEFILVQLGMLLMQSACDYTVEEVHDELLDVVKLSAQNIFDLSEAGAVKLLQQEDLTNDNIKS